MKINLIVFALIFISFIGSVSAIPWTNITCINGDAFQQFNSTIDGENIYITNTQICGNLTCSNNLGCIDPRDTPGEIFFGTMLMFPILAVIFGFLATKFDSTDFTSLRLLFFFLTIIFSLMGILSTYQIVALSGLTVLANSVALGIMTMNATILIIVFVIFIQFIINTFNNVYAAKNKKKLERRGLI